MSNILGKAFFMHLLFQITAIATGCHRSGNVSEVAGVDYVGCMNAWNEEEEICWETGTECTDESAIEDFSICFQDRAQCLENNAIEAADCLESSGYLADANLITCIAHCEITQSECMADSFDNYIACVFQCPDTACEDECLNTRVEQTTLCVDKGIACSKRC